VPPGVIAMRNGDYNMALSLTLASIKDEKKDYFKYLEVANIYYVRAMRENSNREKWAAQAATYAEKSASFGSDDWSALREAAAYEDHVGDLVGQGCPYYVKASGYDQQAFDSLKGDSIWAGDEKFPTQPFRDGLEKSLKSEQDKIRTKCSSKP
jgi:hypothetical protein